MTKNYIFYGFILFFLWASIGSITTDCGAKEQIDYTNQEHPESPKKLEPKKIISGYQGIDVSNHQGKIDWSLVAKDTNIQFVYIKATEGATFVDKSYSYNINEARKNGLKCGSYHYLRNTSSISAQVKNFQATAKIELQDLIPMVDVEEKVEKDSIMLFCNMLETIYGKRPAIYGTNKSYNSFCAPEFNDHILLIGRYGQNCPIITGTGHYSIWQYSEQGQIDGINKMVDLDRVHPDFKIERLYLK